MSLVSIQHIWEIYICQSSVHSTPEHPTMSLLSKQQLRIQYLSLWSTQHIWEVSVTLQYTTQSIYVTLQYKIDWEIYKCHYSMYKPAEIFLSLYSTEHSWQFYVTLQYKTYICDSSSHCIRYRPTVFNVASNIVHGSYTAYSCIFTDVLEQPIRELTLITA